MSSAEADLDVPAVTPAFVPREALAPPDLSATPQVELRSFQALTDGGITFASACFRGSAPGWNPDVDELVERKLVDVAISFGTKIHDPTPLHVTAHETANGVTTQRLAASPPELGEGRTWLGFRDGAPIACVLTCVPTDGRAHDCASLVDSARLRPPIDPTPPTEGALLGALGAMVHHPTATAGALAGALFAVGLALVVRRPKRRRRTHF